MGKQSTRENKTIYQLCREEKELTREKASELMAGVSSSRIGKIKCAIGQRYVPEVEVGELSNIILETIACLNEINPVTGRLIQIARDGKISDDEIKDFAFISQKLDEISLAVDSLNLWVDKTASENDLNVTLLREEKERLKKHGK